MMMTMMMMIMAMIIMTVYSLRLDSVESSCGPRATISLAPSLSVKSIVLRIGLIASLFVLFGQSQASINLKSVGN